MLAPPGELAPPPRGNPGSVTDYKQKFGVNYNIINNNNNFFSLSDYIVHAFAVLFVSVSVPSLTREMDKMSQLDCLILVLTH